MRPFRSRKVTPLGSGGLILGYELTNRAFRPVLDMASKGDRGWKYPEFLRQLAQDPTPLLLEDRWCFDPGAVQPALERLAAAGVPGIETPQKVFNCSNRFEAVSLESHLLKTESVGEILRTMESCQTASFHAAIAPLERAYGLYAHPNNYEFERMNAGVIKALNSHYPSVALLDDSVRSSVYEHLHTSAHRTPSRDVVLETVTAAIRNPLLPLPALREWTPNEFVKLQQSKGADQLREVLRQLKTSEPKDIQRWLDQALASARALDPAENVVYAFAGFGASVLSAVQAAANPYFFIPSVVFAAIGVDQVWNTIDDTIKASEFSWLKVAKTIATWAPPEMRESIDARNA